ncbi:MAG: hypothetical protein AAGA78_00150 [Pseudomonadota bacterium]
MPTVMVEEMVDAAGLYAEDEFQFASNDQFANQQTNYAEVEDKLGNFEIQDLMSRFNQAESLASSLGFRDKEDAPELGEAEISLRKDSGEAHLDYLVVTMDPCDFGLDPMF